MCDAFANSAAQITFIQACTFVFCRAVGMQLHYFVSSSGRKKFSQLQSSHTSLLLEGGSLIFFYTPMIAGEPLFLHRQIAQYLHTIVVYAMRKRTAMRTNSLVNRQMEADISETINFRL